MSPTLLVTSASGNIGSVLVPTLLSVSPAIKLVLPTANAEKVNTRFNLSAHSNAIVEQGSIKDPNWMESLLARHSVTHVFLCVAGTDELLVSLNILNAMVRAGCTQHLIYVSGCGDFTSDAAIQTKMRTCTCMHVLIKSSFELKLKFGELPFRWTVLGPSIFFDNDLRSKDGMLERGWFDEPLSPKGLSRVSLDDIAAAVQTIVLAEDQYKWAGKKIMIGSMHQYTGAETAQLWSEAIGSPVRMMDCDAKSLDMIEDFLGEKTGRESGWGRAIRLMYEMFAENGFGMSAEDYKLQVELLGREPASYSEWISQIGTKWRDSSKC